MNLIVFASLSGNTKEVAELIVSELAERGEGYIMLQLGSFGEVYFKESNEDIVVDIVNGSPLTNGDELYYDDMKLLMNEKVSRIFLGSYTWRLGDTPDEVKLFLSDHVSNFSKSKDGKPVYKYLFGTGDTQFGGDGVFCGALDRIIENYPIDNLNKDAILRIEQSPRGSQEVKVTEWLDGLLRKENGRDKL